MASASFVLGHSEATLAFFAFKFELKYTVILRPDSLDTTLTVSNLGEYETVELLSGF